MIPRYTFGAILLALADGKRVARSGWNGKGMFVFQQVPAQIQLDVIPRMTSLPDEVKEEFLRRGKSISYSNQLALVKADNQINGWAPSVADCLADDWVIVSELPTIPDYQQRVIDEREELSLRLEKLQAFLQTPAFDNLGPEARDLLLTQEVAMDVLVGILDERINLF